jgi:16S rRNA (cytosine967-C5)-methyltransferase
MPRRLARTSAAGGPRALAHEVLVRVETTDAFADALLAARLARDPLAAADQALATRLVYGTLAWQGRLDHHLAELVRRPLARLDPGVRAALRLGLYQLLFLDRVPAYAAVDGSVRLAARAGGAAGRGARGLVNAVLRRAAALGRRGLSLPDPAGDSIGRLAVEWSHPRWLVERWASEMDAEALVRLLAADNTEAPTALRANTLATTRADLVAELRAAGIGVEPSRWAADGALVDRAAARLRALPAWREGRFAFQGEASQLVAPLLALERGARVLDLCAAPGGKAAHAAALLGGTGMVLALDRRPGGVSRLRSEVARLGASTVHAAVADARRPAARDGAFDAVLVDAPCSGLGTLRRHPELRWRRRPEDVPRLAALQRDILTAAAALVRPGGILVYAVCTTTREEGPEVVGALLASTSRFVAEPAALPPELLDAAGNLSTAPHRHGLDGFFAARLRARRDLAPRGALG